MLICAAACRCPGQQVLPVRHPGRGAVAELPTEASAQAGALLKVRHFFFPPQKSWSYWGRHPGFPGPRVVCGRTKTLGYHVWLLSLAPHLLVTSWCRVLFLVPGNPQLPVWVFEKDCVHPHWECGGGRAASSAAPCGGAWPCAVAMLVPMDVWQALAWGQPCPGDLDEQAPQLVPLRCRESCLWEHSSQSSTRPHSCPSGNACSPDPLSCPCPQSPILPVPSGV